MPGWLVTAAAEVPTGDDWLTPDERAVVARLFVPKRRQDFRHGRWTAKRALDAAWRRSRPGPPPVWCIRAAADGAPEAFDAGDVPAELIISLSHSGGLAACALASRQTRSLGCDIERVEPRSDELVEQFFTASEQRRVRAAHPEDRALVACLIWSAKESALKALRTGLRDDTRSVEVEWTEPPRASAWRPFSITRHSLPSSLHGHFRLIESAGAWWVLTVAAEPPLGVDDLAELATRASWGFAGTSC